MKIIQSDKFRVLLSEILDYLNHKNKQTADNFAATLYEKLNNLAYMPYKFRKSFSYDDLRIRDFIFKGFVIPYLVDEENDTIVILGIFKENIFNP